MLNNLTNFFNLIVGRRIKTTLEPTDLIAVGTKQSPALGDYKPTAIQFSDLQAQLGGGGGGISLTTTGTSGPSTLVGSTLNVPQYQGALTLTTVGSSGVSTLIGNTLNIPNYNTGVQSVSGLNTDNTDPLNPVIEISVDGVTITGDGTPGNPLVGSPAGVVSVTGLDTDNTDPLNPIINIAVDGATITGDGTPGNPLVSAGITPSVPLSTNEIIFDNNYIYYTSSTPTTGNITEDLTNAQLGLVQKIYHQDVSGLVVPAGWVLIGAGIYSLTDLNIIYAEWTGGTRVEFWITQEA